jgi:hypothetical protein
MQLFPSRAHARGRTGTQPAPAGCGPLLQRDYIGVLDETALAPEDVIERLRCQFHEFAPPELARFGYSSREVGPLKVGDEMEVYIWGSGWHKVRVVSTLPTSLTLRTLSGHPEAGRVTFGAYRDLHARLIFRICSRARTKDWFRFFGFFVLGKRVQERIWCAFIRKFADSLQARLRDDHVEVTTQEVAEAVSDFGRADEPTFTV